MERNKPDATDLAFLNMLMGEGAVEKAAIDLDPNTAAALGGPAPEQLDQLEQAAASSPAPASPSQEQAAPSEPEEVEAYDRVDAEPPPDEDADGTMLEPEAPSRGTHGKLFTDKRAHPLQILDVLTMKYGTKWADWEPETLWWALRRDFGPVGDLARNKIMALRVAVTTDVPWQDWDVFEDSGLAFNDIVPAIGQFQPMLPMQIAFAVHILTEIREDEPFSHEVSTYIAAILEEHGWVYAPEEYFGQAQQLLDRRVHLLGFKQQVHTMWDRAEQVDPSQIDLRDNNPLDIHILKLFTVKTYLQSRARLRVVVPGAPATASTVTPPVP